jgi:hypothetical protein
MQPYLFPYIGYFQLIEKCDLFVLLDDVNYIKKGYINRNYFVDLHNKTFRYSISVNNVSQNRHIREHSYSDKFITELKSLISQKTSLHKYDSIIDYSQFLESCFSLSTQTVSVINQHSIKWILKILEVKTKLIFSSELKIKKTGEDRIIELCKLLGATQYINSINGMHLYDPNSFARQNIEFKAFQPKLDSLAFQGQPLSILHELTQYELAKEKIKLGCTTKGVY